MWPFTTKSVEDRKPTDAPIEPSIIYLRDGSAVAVTQWSTRMAANAAMTHPVVYRALSKIAESVQQFQWQVDIDESYEGARVADFENRRKAIAEVLASPNDEMTPAMMRYWIGLGYATYGRVPLRVGISGRQTSCPSGLFPLQVEHLSAQYTPRGSVSMYEYGTGEDKQTFLSRQSWNPGDTRGFVDQIWRPSLSACGRDIYSNSNSPLMSIGMPSQVVQHLILRALNSAKGIPNVKYIVTTDGNLTASQQDALRRKINQDHAVDGDLSGNIMLLTHAGKIDVTKVSNDMSDIHSKLPADDMSRMIFSAFGIPLALAGIGASDSAKFTGNFAESRLAFWEDTIIPGYVEPIVQGLTAMLCPPGLKVVANYDSIPAIQHGRANNMKCVSDISFLTTTEKRAMYGFGPAPDGFTEQQTAKLPGETNE